LECFHHKVRYAAWMDARGGAEMHPAGELKGKNNLSVQA
jgi:hypothetical protein